MRARFADHFLAMLGVNLYRDDVAHGARRHEEAGFFAENLGGALLEAIDGRVFAVDVVADLGLGHGAAHGGRGTSDGIAAKIDAHVVMNSAKTSLERRTPRFVKRVFRLLGEQAFR